MWERKRSIWELKAGLALAARPCCSPVEHEQLPDLLCQIRNLKWEWPKVTVQTTKMTGQPPLVANLCNCCCFTLFHFSVLDKNWYPIAKSLPFLTASNQEETLAHLSPPQNYLTTLKFFQLSPAPNTFLLRSTKVCGLCCCSKQAYVFWVVFISHPTPRK